MANSKTKKKKLMTTLALLSLLLACNGAMWEGTGTGTGMGMGMEMEMEMEMESETSRRLLWDTQKKYISYQALKSDAVPCSRPGAPYYNCHALPKAGAYNRGCSEISGCIQDGHP